MQAIIKKDGIKVLKHVLTSPHRQNQEQAIWALGNIAGENFALRNIVLDAGVAEAVANIVLAANVMSLIRGGVWCLANLCRGKPQPMLSRVIPAFKAIAHIIMKHTDEKVLTDASWTLYYLSDGGDERIGIILQSGVVPKLVEHLYNEDVRIALPCLRVLGNITTGTDDQTQIVIDSKALVGLKALLASPHKSLRKESCWVLSNIAAGAAHQLRELLAADVLPTVVRLIREDEFEIKREGLWIISNITSKMAIEHIDYVLNCGVVEALVGLLAVPETKTLAVILQSLTNLLKKTNESRPGKNAVAGKMEMLGSLSTIEQLQYHPNQVIYKMAADILENYFNLEDIDDVLKTGATSGAEGAGISIFDFK